MAWTNKQKILALGVCLVLFGFIAFHLHKRSVIQTHDAEIPLTKCQPACGPDERCANGVCIPESGQICQPSCGTHGQCIADNSKLPIVAGRCLCDYGYSGYECSTYTHPDHDPHKQPVSGKGYDHFAEQWAWSFNTTPEIMVKWMADCCRTSRTDSCCDFIVKHTNVLIEGVN